ncbi:BspA family leucine-rich repeat surface protein [Leuconostoc falkenbergense]|uniref:BspA family leucine-rich repeat surface protein n=1 Tax=Leuconostoc falkenbergense TaxID=2766470 RepID=UPI003F981024
MTSTLNMFKGTTSLWQIKLGANTVFKGNDPSFTAAPAAGTTIIDDGSSYTTLAAEWQIVGTGSPHQPNGAYVTTTEMYEDTPRPVTYVWAHTAPSALISGVHGTSPWTLNPDTGELIYGSGTFQDAQTVVTNLESYDVDPDIVTSISFTGTVNLPANSASMFSGLDKLTAFDATNSYTDNVTNMGSMFYQIGVTSLDLSGWDVTKVMSFNYMFYKAEKLTTLNLSTWGVNRTATTVNMGNMFNGTSALTNLNLTNFKTTNVTSMSYMFYNTGLTSLDLSDWDVTEVTSFNAMFYGSSLRTLNLSGWNTSSAAVSSTFANASSLWKITLGENIKFTGTPSFTAAPAAGTTIPGTSYVTSAASWQAVGTGTEFNPKGALVTTTQMYADRTEPVTYVWANEAVVPTPAINTISSLNFGTLGASDFFNGNSPLATNMATGSVALKDLDNSTTYNVTVAQTSDWTTTGESATIAKSNLKIKYGANDLSTGASSFWSGTSATATKNVALIMTQPKISVFG